MPGIDYSQSIVGAGASAQTDFAAAQARTGLNFRGAARFKRGFKAELGVEAFADASGELSKFIRASIAGTAFARAQAGIQLQLPLNLFDEFGFAVRAEAIAEAAAGLRADLGLSIGDFVLLAQRDQDSIGLPLELLLLFLEEVSIGGAFEVNVSASAKAHASITITGCVIPKAGQKAGFFYTVDAGVGLAAGVGMGLTAGAEFKDFRRFFGRATDKSVDTTVKEIARLLPTSARSVIPILEAFAPVTKIAFRLAYDVGQKIVENNPGASRQHMNTLCNEAVKTILEECQRFLLYKMLESALDTVRNLLAQQAAAIGQTAWDAAMPERSRLASRLLSMPDEPFQPTQGNLDYWQALISAAVDLLSRLYGSSPDPALVEALSILYSASELLLEAVRSKLNKASAYAMAIGAGTVSADTNPFQGALPVQPISMIKSAINSSLGAPPNRNLSYAELLQFLVDDLFVNRLLASSPDAQEFMRIFKNDFGKAENELLKVFLQNAGSFVPPAAAGGQMDPHETLRLIVSSLDRFMADRFRAEALPVILENVPDANTRRYIVEVLCEAVIYIKDVALKSILNWESKTFDNDDFTEALAGVMTLLLGRTVVIVADTFLTAAQEKIGESCDEIAAKIRTGHRDVNVLNLPVDPDFIRLAADCVEIGGEVLGPLPEDTRSRVRHLLYQIFEPIPPGAEQDFLESLGDQLFIPNGDQLRELTDELAAISKRRFALFAERFVLAIGNYILEQLEEILLQVIDLVINWEKHLADSLDDLADLLDNLEAELTRLNGQLIDLFRVADAGLRQFFDVLSGPSLKFGIKSAMKGLFFDKALGVLEDNDIYKNLPREFRRGVRNTLKSTIDGLVTNPLVDPVLNAIGTIADTLDDLLLDCREMDPQENLPEQMMLLVLDKIEDNIRDHFGGTKPHLDVGLDFGFTDFLGNRHSIHISLGRIEVNLNPFLDVVRNTITDLDFYHNALNNACFKLAGALAKESQVAAAELRRNQTREEKRRLDKIAVEHDNGPREITILNPAALSHHAKAVDFKIHLGGVPLSFLGLGKDELQRVLIFLNGELIPVKSLLVEESTQINNPKAHVADFDLGNSKAFDTGTGIFRNHVAQIITDTAKLFPTHAGNRQKRNDGTHFVFSTSEYREQPASKSVYAAAGKRGKSDGRLPVLGVSIKDDSKGRRITQYEIKNNVPGRGNAPSRINELLKDRIAGVLIQFRVELDGLVEGVNVLTLVVVEKGGARHQHNVSFTVTKAKIQKPARSDSRKPLGTGIITLKPLGAGFKAKKQPRRPLTLVLERRDEPGSKTITVNTLLPIDSEALSKKNRESVAYLRDQNRLNFSQVAEH